MQQLSHLIRQTVLLPGFRGSASYWERRYRIGGTSGSGSSGRLAAFKAEILNDFVRAEGVASVLELGCGDGGQLALADYPAYLGLDVSKTCVRHCCDLFRGDASKAFVWYEPAATPGLGQFLAADLTLSLDVIYHLVEDEIYARYLNDLFSAARRYVIVYSSDKDLAPNVPHVRHRRFTEDVSQWFPEFTLARQIDNRFPDESDSQFYVFVRDGGAGSS